MRLVPAILVTALAASLIATSPEVPPVAAAPTCTPGPRPSSLPGAALLPEVNVSKDKVPVSYVRWRGTVPSFDGMPLSVDVTVPCRGAARAQPTVVMAHGFTDDKTVWEETGKSDTVESKDRPQSNSRWNNIWFASRGYVVLTYTARGWRDSCGPSTPGATGSTPAPQCAPFQHWIHLDDKRWEVRDAQWLAAALVQSGLADPRRLAITGGSYGGGPASMGALLANRIACGGAAVPPTLGLDPCAGKADGELVPWTTPDGALTLTWAAALPLYTFGDLIQVLAPNGRGSDGWERAPPDGDHTKPFGVPLASTVSGLLLIGNLTGTFARPGGDPDADIVTTTNRLLAGNPFSPTEPLVAAGIRAYREFKSPVTTAPQGRVPIFWVQGFTDALFPGSEALMMMNHVRATSPNYPFKLFLGDLGHDYTGERQDEWDLVKGQMNEFIDHYLRPDRTPRRPAFDVGATITRCLDHDAPLRYVSAMQWHDLHPRHATLVSTEPGTTSTDRAGPAGLATDPISTATLPGPNSYKGCRIMRPSQADPTVATYEFPLTKDLVLMGGPVVEVDFDSSGADVPLSVRLWDVAGDGSAQGLVTRGTYRVSQGPAAGANARFQIAPQGYRFPAGHRIKVEVTANDSPYYQASNVQAEVTLHRLELTLPLLRTAAERSSSVSTRTAHRTAGAPADSGRGHWPAVGLACAGLLLAGGLALWRRRAGSEGSGDAPVN